MSSADLWHIGHERTLRALWQNVLAKLLPVGAKCAANATFLTVEFTRAPPRQKEHSGEIWSHCHAITMLMLSLRALPIASYSQVTQWCGLVCLTSAWK